MHDSIEIVVVASRIQGAIDFGSFPAWNNYYKELPPYLRDDQWLYGPYPNHATDFTSPDHLKKILIASSIATFNELFEDLLGQLQFRDLDTIISLDFGYSVTIGEVISKLQSLKFQVYDKSFSGPGYAGANYGDRVEIQYQHFAGYTSRGAYDTNYGFNYLVLHELAHNTAFGIASRSWAINSYRDTGSAGFYGAGNQHFATQERYANTIARSIADALVLSITSPSEPDFPSYGFNN